MRRFTLIVSGLVSLVLGIFLTVAPAAADEPPAPVQRTLVNQRVELLPQEPLCWNVNQGSRLPGSRTPAEGFRAQPLTVA